MKPRTIERAWQSSGENQWLRADPSWVNPVIGWANKASVTGSLNGVDFAAEHARLRWLLKLMADGRPPIRALRQSFGTLRVSGIATMNTRGDIGTTSTAEFSTMEQWYATALAALIDAGMADRVKQCAYVDRDSERCRKYFVQWPRRGRPQEYCCKQHENNASKQRTRS